MSRNYKWKKYVQTKGDLLVTIKSGKGEMNVNGTMMKGEFTLFPLRRCSKNGIVGIWRFIPDPKMNYHLPRSCENDEIEVPGILRVKQSDCHISCFGSIMEICSLSKEKYIPTSSIGRPKVRIIRE